jgi:hypothetical protein
VRKKNASLEGDVNPGPMNKLQVARVEIDPQHGTPFLSERKNYGKLQQIPSLSGSKSTGVVELFINHEIPQ